MEKESKTKKRTSTAASKRKITLLEAIETIVDKSRHSHLSDKFMKECHDEIQLIADSYGITPQQAILFCITLECGPYHVRFNELPSFLDMSNVKSLSFVPDINEMITMRILRYCDRDKDSFSVSESVLSALRETKAMIRPSFIIEDFASLFEVLDIWLDRLNDTSVSPSELTEDLQQLYKDNSRKIGFAKQMLDLGLNNHEMLMLTFFCHRLVNADDNNIIPNQLSDLFERRGVFKRQICELTNGKHSLMEKGWVEHVCLGGTADTSSYTLTDKAKRELLGEIQITEPTLKMSGLTEPAAIKPKTLFYPNAMQRQIDELNSFLDDKQFQDIQQRLEDSGFRTGFACLFYGAPGTGKTETVYQLARATGRSIMLVDVPQIKSKWVGDSEKNIKAIFDHYRNLVNRSGKAPILLFNEADAIFGVRKNGAENAVDKMENTIQNIILQEMENLNGIMIATTNLAGNLDSAFERRFLYKVKFENPDASVRSRIWQEMIPALSEKDATTLAKAFELSGGQIENVARKNTINCILHGESRDRLSTLMDYCKAETLESPSRPRHLGFK